MKKKHHQIVNSWFNAIEWAIFFTKDEDAAYKLTIGFIRRLRELGLL
jgi:hypothetical protein